METAILQRLSYIQGKESIVGRVSRQSDPSLVGGEGYGIICCLLQSKNAYDKL